MRRLFIRPCWITFAFSNTVILETLSIKSVSSTFTLSALEFKSTRISLIKFDWTTFASSNKTILEAFESISTRIPVIKLDWIVFASSKVVTLEALSSRSRLSRSLSNSTTVSLSVLSARSVSKSKTLPALEFRSVRRSFINPSCIILASSRVVILDALSVVSISKTVIRASFESTSIRKLVIKFAWITLASSRIDMREALESVSTRRSVIKLEWRLFDSSKLIIREALEFVSIRRFAIKFDWTALANSKLLTLASKRAPISCSRIVTLASLSARSISKFETRNALSIISASKATPVNVVPSP